MCQEEEGEGRECGVLKEKAEKVGLVGERGGVETTAGRKASKRNRGGS